MRYRHFSNLHQLVLALAGFAGLVLLLDTGGLHAWATRLDLGPERAVAVPVTDALARVLRPLHTSALRGRELALLGRLGWSDDPADTVADDAPPTAAGLPAGTPATTLQPVDHPLPPTLGTGASSTVATPSLGALAEPPLTRPPLHLTALPSASPTRTVALAGDSMMAVGLAPNLLNHAPQHPALHFLKAFKSGTGLARPEVFNWQKEYPAMVGSAHPDVIVVAIGANDGQGFVEGKTTYPFGTDAWQQVYATRVEAYLRMLDRDGAQVLWLGLPPMKSTVYNTHIALVNRVTYAVVTQHPRVTWVSLAGLVGDETGGFREYGSIGDRIQPLRQPDGIHLSDAGASLVTAELLPWLAASATTTPTPTSTLNPPARPVRSAVERPQSPATQPTAPPGPSANRRPQSAAHTTGRLRARRAQPRRS